jgi:hypothetical protein
MTTDFGVIELILVIIMGLLAYLWKTQASDVRKTIRDLNELSIRFAEAKGGADATNKTLFSHIEEMKEAIARVENLLLNK